MKSHATSTHRLFLSFVMGLTVLILALAQGGPGIALAAIGRGMGLVKPGSPTPAVSDIFPYELLAGSPTPTTTPTATSRPRRGTATTTPAPTSTPAKSVITPSADDVSYSHVTTWSFPDEPRIDAMRLLIGSTLKERELSFTGASGKVSTFYPGDGYRKLWARDFATMLPTVQYLYGDDYLRSGIEELLIRQYTDQTRSSGGDNGTPPGAGALPGIVGPDGSVQKNTATSDEETSVINAAYEYYKVAGGLAWLNKDLGGRSVLERLQAAMEWLYANRFDSTHRLIKRAHTTDWGDVKFERGGDPTDINPNTDHWTASIYDQALTFSALRELAEMAQAAGQDDAAKTLIVRADDLRQATDRWLWMPERGYYRIHIHITPLTHSGFNEDDIVAIGNAVAVYSGMTTPEQEASIFKKLEETRLAAGARKPGLSLYPTYPAGFFASVQRNPGEYQNGGLWDWWGGVQMTAEFQQGDSDVAIAHLYQVAADWALHPDAIWEWSAPNSAFGRGSKGYASAAGTVGESIITGLYGVSISSDGLRLEPRLATHSGDVRVYQPATDEYVAYRYTSKPDAITLLYGTNVTGEVSLRVLIPRGQLVQRLTVGSKDLVPKREVVGNDVYAVFKGPSGTTTVTIALAPIPIGSAGQAIDPSFFDYYQNHDGSRLLGAPLTLALMEGTKRVQYFEKGELEDLRSTTNDPVWQFSYGLMGEEIVRAGADLPVGGEVSTITYAKLKDAAADNKRLPLPAGFKSGVAKNKDGTVFIPFSPDLSPAPGHNVAAIFWIVLSSDSRSPGGWLHDVGLPLTEPVWATVDKGAEKGRKVLIQAFQRAILTYDAQNAPGWQVERTNLGVDYLKAFPDRGKP